MDEGLIQVVLIDGDTKSRGSDISMDDSELQRSLCHRNRLGEISHDSVCPCSSATKPPVSGEISHDSVCPCSSATKPPVSGEISHDSACLCSSATKPTGFPQCRTGIFKKSLSESDCSLRSSGLCENRETKVGKPNQKSPPKSGWASGSNVPFKHSLPDITSGSLQDDSNQLALTFAVDRQTDLQNYSQTYGQINGQPEEAPRYHRVVSLAPALESKPPSYMWLALLTIFFNFVIGLIALVIAVQSDHEFWKDNIEKAKRLGKIVKVVCVLAISTTCLVILVVSMVYASPNKEGS